MFGCHAMGLIVCDNLTDATGEREIRGGNHMLNLLTSSFQWEGRHNVHTHSENYFVSNVIG